MIFTVCRTSGGRGKPCEEAENFTEYYKEYDSQAFDVINIKNLKDLVKFINKYGKIVIREGNCEKYPLEIEIYDNYRE